eukprot:1156716-Pelagomonas_calceolata.AAC.3
MNAAVLLGSLHTGDHHQESSYACPTLPITHLYPKQSVYRWTATLFVTRTCSDTYSASKVLSMAWSARNAAQRSNDKLRVTESYNNGLKQQHTLPTRGIDYDLF